MKYDVEVILADAKYQGKKLLAIIYAYESGKSYTKKIYLTAEELAKIKVALADTKI